MDTFFATKKGGRSSQGHTCCQLFVTDKGFLYVVPMRRKSEVLQALKQFAKEIGAPTSIIADMSGEQMSHDVQKFCNDIGTTLRALEEGTPWSKGWKLLIKWKDKSKAWINLADMKEAHPVETAEYARARGISNEPAFAWWVPYTLRKREIILAAVKNWICKMTHKYGIEIPRDVEHAHEIDSRNGNAMWRDALKKEMYNVGVAFEILDEGAHAPHGWK